MKVLLTIFLLISSLYVRSAQTPDSLRQERYIRENPVWVDRLPDGYNWLGVTAGLQKGTLIPSQGATQAQRYRLDAEGKTTWRKIQLYGRFAYTRTLEDSTRLRHQTRINPTAPVYFGSLRYNHYERSVYTLGVAAQRNLVGESLPLTVAVDYRIGEHFSNNDPRGGINDFQLDIHTGLGYRTGQWAAHASGRYDYGRERAQVAFKNEDYAGNVEDPLYVNWYMNGYGNAVQRISNPLRRYDDGFRRFGVGGHLLFAPPTANEWKLDVNWQREQQRFKWLDNSEETYTLLNEYTLDKVESVLAWQHKQDAARDVRADLRVAIFSGSDQEPLLKATNYTYHSEELQGNVYVYRSRWQYGAGVSYQSIQQQDGVIGTNSLTSALQVSAQGKRLFPLVGKQQLRAGIRGGYRYPMTHQLTFPTLDDSGFAAHIVYHDFLYRASETMQWGASLTYAIPTNKNLTWEINLDVDYWRRMHLPTYNFIPPSAPGGDRLSSTLQLGVFF